jgi:flagella basal body P-ring formation protein FlgA
MKRISMRLVPVLLALCLAAPAASAPSAENALAVRAREALTAAVVDQAGVPGVEVFVSGVRFQDPFRASEGGDVVRVSLDGAVRSGRSLMFGLFVRSANGEVREMRASADISVQVPVVVAARSLSTGMTLAPEDLAVRRKDLSASGEALLHDPSEAVGRRVRWQLSAGVPVRREYLEDPEALKRGDTVLIEAESGTVRISGKGVALQSGRIGETVLVKSHISGKEMAGRLAPGHVVRVD